MILKNMNGRNYLIQERNINNVLSNLSLKMMERNEIHGLLPFKNVQQDNDLYYRYTLHSDEMLVQWLEKTHTKKQVIGMLEDILVIGHELEMYLLPQSHLCTEIQSVSVFHNLCEFAYIPEEEYEQTGLFDLLKYILFHIRYAVDEDFSYLFDLQNAFNRGDVGSLEDVGKWIRIVNGIETEEKEDEEYNLDQRINIKPAQETAGRADNDYEHQNLRPQEQAGLSADVLKDFQLDESQSKKVSARGLFGKKNKNENSDESPAFVDLQTPPIRENNIARPDIINALNREDHTVLMLEGANDVLIRTKTGEEFSLIKENCVIGSGSQAAYIISDNRTISRQHARIFLNGGAHFIEDLGSTNGTTVNGEVLRRNEPYKLENMSRIMLSDEEFIYETRR